MRCEGPAASDPLAGAPSRRLLGLDFADLDLPGVLARLAARRADAAFAYVVTPNADHLVRLARQPALAPLHEGAALRLLDSRVVARLARGFGLAPPPMVPGSDLAAALFGPAGGLDPAEPLTILGAPAAAVGARGGPRSASAPASSSSPG